MTYRKIQEILAQLPAERLDEEAILSYELDLPIVGVTKTITPIKRFSSLVAFDNKHAYLIGIDRMAFVI